MATPTLNGIAPIVDYTTGTNKEKVARLRDLIPDPDTTSSTGAIAHGAGSNLDEMSPIAAAHLRVELIALEAAIANA